MTLCGLSESRTLVLLFFAENSPKHHRTPLRCVRCLNALLHKKLPARLLLQWLAETCRCLPCALAAAGSHTQWARAERQPALRICQ